MLFAEDLHGAHLRIGEQCEIFPSNSEACISVYGGSLNLTANSVKTCSADIS